MNNNEYNTLFFNDFVEELRFMVMVLYQQAFVTGCNEMLRNSDLNLITHVVINCFHNDFSISDLFTHILK